MVSLEKNEAIQALGFRVQAAARQVTSRRFYSTRARAMARHTLRGERRGAWD